MAKAARLSVDQLEQVRTEVLRHGGVLFKRMCPRPDCHSAVVQCRDTVVCLTCGWHRPGRQWGERQMSFTPQQAVEGSKASYRALALLIEPDRWQRLARRARKRGQASTAARFEAATSDLSPAIGPQRPVPATVSTPRVPAGGQPGRRPLLTPKLGRTAAQVLIFTDGGCDPNPGPGGWAAILWTPGMELELAGGDRQTTNNRMELTAALQGLKALNQPSRVTVVTDSQYLFNSMTKWITAWSKQRWRRRGEPIPNADLWQALAQVSLVHQTSWAWTPAHSGQPENERCDRLARSMRGQASSDALGTVFHRRRRPRSGPLPRLPAKPTAPLWLPPSELRAS